MFLRVVVPDPRFRVVFPLPALLKVAVSALPGTGEAVQFVVVAHVPLVVPFQVALTAEAVGADANQTAKAAARRESVTV